MPYNANTNDLFKVLHILKLNDIYKLHLGQFMFPQMHRLSPTPPTPELINNLLNHNQHQCETHNQHRLHVEYARTKTMQYSLFKNPSSNGMFKQQQFS